MQGAFVRYALALVIAVLMVLARWALIPVIGAGTLYITLFPIMMAVAVTLGMGPGLLGNAVGILLVEYFLIEPGGQIALTLSLAVRSAIMLLTTVYVGRVGDKLRAARQQAKQDAAEWEQTFDSVPDLIAILDREHRVVRANRAMAERLGVSAVQCRGATCYRVVHGTEAPPDFCPHVRAITERRECVTEVHEPRLGGDFSVSCTPQFDARGAVKGTVHVAHDITARKQAETELRQLNEQLEQRVAERTAEVAVEARKVEAERQRLYDVLETLPAMVCLLAPDYRVPFANRAFREKFGESHGRRCYEYCFNRSAPCEFCESYEVLKTGQPHHWEVKSPDGSVIEAHDFPFTDVDGTRMILEMDVDVTAVRRAEDALKQLNETLEQRVTERTRDLRRVGADLDRAQAVGQLGSWRLDTRQNVLTWSDENHRIFGVPKGTPLTYEAFLSAVHPDDRTHVDTQWKAAMLGAPYDIEHRIVADGKTKWVREKAYLEFDADGTLLGGFGITQDITERRLIEDALRVSEERFRGIVETAEEGIATHAPDGTITYVNQRMADLLGYSRNEILGRSSLDFVDADEREEVIQARESIKDRGSFSQERKLRRKDGSTLWTLANVTPRKDGAGSYAGYLAMHTDITARKQAEEALRAAKAAAEHANKAKDEFLAVLSHELRTPLTAMLGWVRMLQTREFDKATAQKGLAVIERNVKTQTRIIEDLLEVSRIVTGKMTIEKLPVDLADVVSEIATEYQPIAESRKLALHCQHPDSLLVDGDKARLRQVVWNLLSNAVKFTPPGGRIDVALQLEDDQAVLMVSDTGRGIGSDFLPHLFQRFKQEDTGASRRYMGLGIGLALASSIVQLHGGSIAARSAGEGQGTTITVKIPLLVVEPASVPAGRDAGPTAAGAEAGAPPLRGAKVLIVDDDEDVRELLAAVLKYGGAEVAAAGSAGEALKLCRQFQPAVLVSDIGMPDEDGCVLIRKLRALEQQEGRAPLPAIALTGFAQPEDAARAKAAGYQAHAAKPIEPEVLIKRVANTLGKA